MHKDKAKKSPKFFLILSILLVIFTIITNIYIIHAELFSIFYDIIIVLISGFLTFCLVKLLNSKLKKFFKIIVSFIVFLIIIIEGLLMIFGTKALKFISNLTDTGYRVNTYGIYVLKDSSYSSLSYLDGKNIGYLNLSDGDIINDALDKLKNKVSIGDTLSKDSLTDLYSGLDASYVAIVMNVSYEDVFKDEYPDEFDNLRMIDTSDVVTIVNTLKSDKDVTSSPFTIYISGIDTSGEVSSSARSDVNIVLSVNPSTKQILMISTPRDTYVTLGNNGKKDKLTHAGIYGIEDSVSTLEKLYDMDIDYYVRVNFTSFIKIINTLGGVEVDVPADFCESDENRSTKTKDQICLSKGVQTLTGEQALALARNRHAFAAGDVARGEHQMLILQAIINKLSDVSSVSKLSEIIDDMNGRVSTNMSTTSMYKFARMQIKEDIKWNFTSVSLEGDGGYGKCYSLGNDSSYVMYPDSSSVSYIHGAYESLINGEEISTTSTTTSSGN